MKFSFLLKPNCCYWSTVCARYVLFIFLMTMIETFNMYIWYNWKRTNWNQVMVQFLFCQIWNIFYIADKNGFLNSILKLSFMVTVWSVCPRWGCLINGVFDINDFAFWRLWYYPIGYQDILMIIGSCFFRLRTTHPPK